MKKRNKFISTLAAAAMVAVMAGATLPTTALAEGRSGASDGSMIVSKTATLEDDGTYTIQLEAFSTGETLTVMKQTPTDIVLVLDVSGSMEEEFTYTSGKNWTSVKDKVRDMPSDAHHLCPDGTYSPVTWSREGLGKTTYRYTCNNCKATRKWSVPLSNTIPGEGDKDSWNLWRYTDIKETKNKMLALQNAVKSFIDGVAAKNAGIADPNEQHRVAIVKFASETTKDTIGNETYEDGGYTYNYTQTVAGLTTVTADTAADLDNKVDALKPGGATAADKGMKMAQGILANSSGRDKVVILFTDGEPTYGNSFTPDVANRAVATSKALKDNKTVVYSVGLFNGADPDDKSDPSNAYLNGVSSNYPEATAYKSLGNGKNDGYYKTCDQTGNLTDVFNEIESSIGTTTVTLNTNAELRDVLNEGFVLTDDSAVTVQVDTYKGRDRYGNRVFNGTPTPLDTANCDVDKTKNVVTVSGFDYSQEYLIDGDEPDSNDFTAARQGKKIIVKITGVEATDPAVTNSQISTNSVASGIYDNGDATIPYVVFPQPMTQLSSKVYVMDYAKSVSLTDLPNAPKHMASDGMHKFSTAVTSLDMAYGKANGNSYTPTTTLWNDYDDYYIFGQWNTTPEGVTTGDNTWTKISVLPANNVYYEDTFVTDKTTDTVGIVYSPDGWNTVAEGSNTGDTINDEHGWITSMNDDTTYSDGTVATGSAGATATFSFTGTGVDIYSRTDMTTGLVVAKLYKGEDTTTPASMVKSLTVDNLAQFGTYYQIPTVSFSNLEHGTYTVKLKVVSTTKTTGKERSTYYLDGIRVYNPLSDEQEAKDIVQEAYGDEIGASFQSVRDILIVANSLEDGAQNVSGAVFIDYNPDKDENDTATSATIKTYEDYGPKNEVYLAQGQAIAFKVDTAVSKLSVGLKAPSGATTAQVTNGADTSEIEINAASDQYYVITPNSEGYVVIKNTGDNLLSVTKLKMSGEPIESANFSMNVDTAMAYANSFDSLPVVAYTLMDAETAAPDAGEAQEPEQGDADIETPEEPEQGDVVIENPEEPAPVAPSAPVSDSWISELFRAIRKILWR
ncbi:VWA domain-containing protein [bacterium]|nr:VWA domain-containing protein [bacterium]